MNLAVPHLQTSRLVSVENEVEITACKQKLHRLKQILKSLSSAAAAAKFRRDSLFCPDELDSLFSYFDTGSGPRSKSSTQLLPRNAAHL